MGISKLSTGLGLIFDKKYEEAFKYFTDIQNNDIEFVDYYIGEFYKQGWATEKDYHIAERHFRIAADKGSIAAKLRLIECLLEQNKNYEEAMSMALALTASNFPPAYYHLGKMYECGLGVEVDEDKAMEYFKILTESDSPELEIKDSMFNHYRGMAEFAIASLYLEGNSESLTPEEINKRDSKALAYLTSSGSNGNIHAQYCLLYQFGLNPYKDPETIQLSDWDDYTEIKKLEFSENLKDKESKKYNPLIEQIIQLETEKATEGIRLFEYILGLRYLYGYAVEKDLRKGFALLARAADKGLGHALLQVGSCYLEGFGVAKDYNKTHEYYLRGNSILDSSLSNKQLGISYSIKGTDEDFKLSKLHYEKALEGRERPYSLFKLGKIYENGWGVVKDLKKARKYYSLAAETGDVGGKVMLAMFDLAGLAGKADAASSLALIDQNLNLSFDDLSVFFQIIRSWKDYSESRILAKRLLQEQLSPAPASPPNRNGRYDGKSNPHAANCCKNLKDYALQHLEFALKISLKRIDGCQELRDFFIIEGINSLLDSESLGDPTLKYSPAYEYLSNLIDEIIHIDCRLCSPIICYRLALLLRNNDRVKSSVKILRSLAEQGLVIAQYVIGEYYRLGHGLPQNFMQAHIWLNLASSGGVQKAYDSLRKVSAQLNGAQVVEAQNMAMDFSNKFNAAIIGFNQFANEHYSRYEEDCIDALDKVPASNLSLRSIASNFDFFNTGGTSTTANIGSVGTDVISKLTATNSNTRPGVFWTTVKIFLAIPIAAFIAYSAYLAVLFLLAYLATHSG